MKLPGEPILRRRETLHTQLNDRVYRLSICSSAFPGFESGKSLPSIPHQIVIADSLNASEGERFDEYRYPFAYTLVKKKNREPVQENELGTLPIPAFSAPGG